MAEDVFVQMLLEISGGTVADERDIDLARAAARWADQHGGWQLHLFNSFFIEAQLMAFWVLANRATQTLEIRVRLGAGRGWKTHARHQIASVGHGLDVLAAEQLLPPRFAPLGRRALEDFAATLDRSATAMVQLGEDPAGPAEEGPLFGWEMTIRAATLNQAADQARAFPRGELAVTV